jgi:hypothetical protein
MCDLYDLSNVSSIITVDINTDFASEVGNV